ncbi:hypothetical protein J6590_059980 [Homalodisca vitripennis]|nr:hypothetical protein J6590_059980 [Homalodisca vitripennis]
MNCAKRSPTWDRYWLVWRPSFLHSVDTPSSEFVDTRFGLKRTRNVGPITVAAGQIEMWFVRRAVRREIYLAVMRRTRLSDRQAATAAVNRTSARWWLSSEITLGVQNTGFLLCLKTFVCGTDVKHSVKMVEVVDVVLAAACCVILAKQRSYWVRPSLIARSVFSGNDLLKDLKKDDWALLAGELVLVF